MKNIIKIEKFGGPEEMKLVREESDSIENGEIRVQIKAIGVNRADILIRKGAYHTAKLPATPGFEAAGVVTESMTSEIPVGSRVLIYASRKGLYTSEAVVQARDVALIPENVSFEDAASLPINWITSFYSIRKLLHLQPGQTMLVCGAASGVGLSAIQIAKQLKAKVIAGASSDEKLSIAKKFGADQTINYSKQDLSAEVMRLTDGKGVDTVLEIIGGKFFAQSLKLLTPFGRLVSLANVTLEDSVINTRDFYPKNASIFGFQYGALLGSGRYNPKEDLTWIMEQLSKGVFKPFVEKTFLLEQAGIAHEYLESRSVIGKLVLEVR